MALNPRQKRFAELYQLSGNASDAYMESYGTQDANVAKSAASRLLTDVNVQQYLQSLQKEASEEFKTDRRTMLNLFHGIAFDAAQEPRDRISAGKEICRIEGHYEAQRLDVTHSVENEFSEMLRGLTGAKEKE